MENLKVKYNSERTRIYACCPFCEDAGKTADVKYHLFIAPGKYAFCFRCGYKSSFLKLSQRYSIDTSIFKEEDTTVKYSPSDFDVDVKANVIDFNDSMYSEGAVNYLHKRKLDDYLIKKMCIRLGTDKLFGRVVFTDTVNRYYVARAFLPGLDPKTLNPKSALRPLMYLHKDIYETLYIVEGCFDAVPFIKTKKEVAVLLGKDLSQFQIKQLQSRKIENIVIALDTDAYKTAQLMSGILAGALPFVNIGIMTYESGNGKDPGDYDLSLFEHISIYWTRIINNNNVDKTVGDYAKR